MDLSIEVLTQVQNAVKPYVDKYPVLKRPILEEYELCISEIEDGGSFEHETELMVGSIKEIVGE